MDEITVVALGPDRANQMTLEAAEALARAASPDFAHRPPRGRGLAAREGNPL